MTESKSRSEETEDTIARRQVLGWGAATCLAMVGCGNESDGATEQGLREGNTGNLPESPPLETGSPGTVTEVGSPAPATSYEENFALDPLSLVDTVVVLMMENRSFDHYFGALAKDSRYPGASRVDGLRGDEWNPNGRGERVGVHRLSTLTPADPPHDWNGTRTQWNGGKNDGFVRAHAGPHETEVMGFYERYQLGVSYWLADEFTVCDRWFSSVLGPTWPNRAVLHAGTAQGLTSNVPFLLDCPRTLWEVMADAGKTAKNYYAGLVPWYAGAFIRKLLSGVNPTAPLQAFFEDAKRGTLPHLAIIDPDFSTNDDHPSHSVHLGQALIATIYRALAASPQWERCLFLVIYDEHGGFYDHVAPPTCTDDRADFQQLGFRIPALAVGPWVARGRVCSTPFEHASVGVTMAKRFGLAPWTERQKGTQDLGSCLAPDLVGSVPRRPPELPPVVVPSLSQLLTLGSETSQPELEAMAKDRRFPTHLFPMQTRAQRLDAWLRAAHDLGAIVHEGPK